MEMHSPLTICAHEGHAHVNSGRVIDSSDAIQMNWMGWFLRRRAQLSTTTTENAEGGLEGSSEVHDKLFRTTEDILIRRASIALCETLVNPHAARPNTQSAGPMQDCTEPEGLFIRDAPTLARYRRFAAGACKNIDPLASRNYKPTAPLGGWVVGVLDSCFEI
jgi:hypothetical protein